MIILGPSKKGAAMSILSKIRGSGESYDTMKDENQEHMAEAQNGAKSDQALDQVANRIMDAMKAGDASGLKHALKEFIKMCD